MTYTGWIDAMAISKEALRTGYQDLDNVVRIPQAAITLVAGRPAHGKTAFMFNLMLSMAEVYPQKRFMFFSFEEPSHHILTKVLNVLVGEDLQEHYWQYPGANTNYSYLKAYLKHKRTNVPVIEVAKLKLQELLDSGRVQVIDGNHTVEDLDGILAGEIRKEGLPVGSVFLDYIQRMHTSKQTQDKRTEIAHISDQVLQIAKGTGLPLILGAQINRDAVGSTKAVSSTKKEARKPALENLKEAGNLEEDANLVLSVFNLSRETPKTEDGESWGQEVELELTALKNRDGKANASVKVTFDQWTGRIKNKETETW
jgi:replicative DNA helicase